MSSQPDKNFQLEQANASDDSIQQAHAQLLKQKPEKASGYSFLPLGVLGLLCTTVFFGSIYLAHNSVRFDPLVFSEAAKREKPGANAVVALTRAQLGKKVFSVTCITCHQANGLGVPGQYPPLAGSEWVQGNEERVIRIVLHGLNGPITVKGTEFNNVMAPLGEALKDEQIANVISYVRAEWGNTAAEVTPELVAKVRADTAGRKTYWTVPELQKVGP
jgi:mono/diheme cytochrome c family protein